MKELKSKSLLIYDPETGEKKEIDIFRGESAYEAAVRLGMTTLSEEQWVREYDANRDAAIAAIEVKAKEALESIPEDYTELNERAEQLSEEIDYIYNGAEELDAANIEQGTINSIGITVSNSTRLRSKGFWKVRAGSYINFVPGEKTAHLLISSFDTQKNYIRDSVWLDSRQNIAINDDGYIVCIFKNSTNTDIMPGDFDAAVTLHNNSLSHIPRMSASNFVWTLTDGRKCAVNAGGVGPLTLEIELGGWMLFASAKTGEKFTTKEEFKTQLGDACTIGDTLITVTVPMRHALAFDVEELVYKIVHISSLSSRYALIAATYSGKGVVGAAVNLANTFKTNSLEAAVDEVENVIKNQGIPQYWVNYLEGRLPELQNAIMAEGMQTESFIFLTDVHITLTNKAYSANIIDWVRENLPVKNCIMGGDFMYYDPNKTREGARKNLFRYHQIYNTRGVLNVLGNHEIQPYNGSDAFTLDEVYNVVYMNAEEKTDVGGLTYYAFDNESKKMRYIILDNAVVNFNDNAVQANWLAERLTEMQDGWTAVLFSHKYMQGEYPSTAQPGTLHSNITRIAQAYNDRSSVSVNDSVMDFSIGKGRVACLICGHMHYDFSTKHNDIWVIATTTDGGWDSYVSAFDEVKRTAGTTDEHAVDIFSINPETRHISAHRIGFGNDREWNY